MLYQDFREWLAAHFKGCTDHGNVMPDYILRTLDELVQKHEKKTPVPAATPLAGATTAAAGSAAK